MWIITRAINEYDQDGEYMFSVFVCDKPSREELRLLFYGEKYNPQSLEKNEMNEKEKFITHLLNGGGRMCAEHTWYYLTEMTSGQEYINRQ